MSYTYVIVIRRLKDFALRLPEDSTLKRVLLAEEDMLSVEEFLIKLPLWLRLSNQDQDQ